MVFSSLIFLYLFLPLCVLLYLISPSLRSKNAVLIAFSFVFYAWGEPVYVLLLLASAFVNYGAGVVIGRCDRLHLPLLRRVTLVLTVVLDLGALGFFKYAGFLVENINAVTGLALPAPELTLPIGISFYTFQALSYVIDVYRGEVGVQKSYAKYLLYLSLFPQLIAGPIVRYSEIEEQIERRRISAERLFTGLTRFCVGLGKKVLIANYCGSMATQLLEKTGSLTTVGAWLGILMYTFQIYFDFSGYSDMAIGLGRMLGFQFSENFDYPYISRSITEFWRRWHISLSSFFRDYVYIPLGGNRRHLYLNLFIVWALTGLWHGASWNFVLWGLYFFVLLCLEKRFAATVERIPRVVQHVLTLLLIMFGWTLFYFTDLTKVGQTFAAMFGFGAGWCGTETRIRLVSCLPLIAVAAVGSTRLPCLFAKGVAALCGGWRSGKPSAFFYVLSFAFDLLVLWLATVSLVGASYNPFLYFRF